MPRKHQETIDKLSARQVRFLANPDRDPELTEVVAKPVDIGREQKKNYAVDGIVKALKDMNPVINKISQKNAIVKDKRDSERGTLAALQGIEPAPDSSNAYIRAYEVRAAKTLGGEHNAAMNDAWKNKPEDQTREAFIAEWKEKAQNDASGRSTEFASTFLALASAETLRIDIGGQAKDVEQLAIANRTDNTKRLKLMLSDPNVKATVDTLQEWRDTGKDSGLTSDEINEDVVTQIEIDAKTGNLDLFELVSKGNKDGNNLLNHPNFRTRLATAEQIAIKKQEEDEVDTQAKVNFANREATKEKFSEALTVVAEGGSQKQALAMIDIKDYDALDASELYWEDYKKIVGQYTVKNYDPSSYPDYMDRVGKNEVIAESIIWQDPSLNNIEKGAIVRALQGDTGVSGIIKTEEFKVAKLGGTTQLRQISDTISVTGAEQSRAADGKWQTENHKFIHEELLTAATEGLVNELSKEPDTSKYPEIRKRWGDNLKVNLESVDFNQQNRRRSLFIYRTRKSLQHAFTNGYISQEMMELHQVHFDAEDEEARQVKAKRDEDAALLYEQTRPRTFDEKRTLSEPEQPFYKN